MKKVISEKDQKVTLKAIRQIVEDGTENVARVVNTAFEKVEKRIDGVEIRIDGVDDRLDKVDARLAVLEVDGKDVKSRLDKIEASIASLAGTLDAFLKRLTAHEEEFEILKSEVKVMKRLMKEKLHIDVEREMASPSSR